ncbi:MAG: class II fructose-bisphosphate aldolase [Planctomycetia bacterium]|nr:class II fructose-bisphosphate aldolase [Planctomycetia bacterium]
MLVNLKEVLDLAAAGTFAVPAFNVYNMETVMGIVQAAEETRSPLIMQTYSRLFTSGAAFYLAPSVLAAAQKARVPVCFHLDHGAGQPEVLKALRYGCTGIMYDCSALPLDQNIEKTKQIVSICDANDVPVEGELGHIGSAADDSVSYEYTKVDEAIEFVAQTNVVALAIQVGTAHGHYKKAPQIDVPRIAEIAGKIPAAVVLHGGSGIPDDQIRAAIDAGIRKVNFGTDVCFSFLDRVFETSREKFAVDVFMRGPIESVKNFAIEKIKLLKADGRV